MKGKPTGTTKIVKGTKVVGKPITPRKKKKSKNLAEHTRGLKATIKY